MRETKKGLIERIKQNLQEIETFLYDSQYSLVCDYYRIVEELKDYEYRGYKRFELADYKDLLRRTQIILNNKVQ